MPLFSVVIPSYNYAHFLPRALGSVLQQEFRDFEVIVIDDGSSDNTEPVIRHWQLGSDRPIIYSWEPRRGLGAARNRGIDLATGGYVLFLDADDALLPGSLERFRLAIGHGGEPDFVWGGMLRIEVDRSIAYMPPGALSPNKEDNFRRFLSFDLTAPYFGTLAFKRSTLHGLRFVESLPAVSEYPFYACLFAHCSGTVFRRPVAKIYRHLESLSHRISLAFRSRLQAVHLTFDRNLLPTHLLPMRQLALTQAWIHLLQYTGTGVQQRNGELRDRHRAALHELVDPTAWAPELAPPQDRDLAEAALTLSHLLSKSGQARDAQLLSQFARRVAPRQPRLLPTLRALGCWAPWTRR